MTASTPPRRVIYVVSLFPCWSETFIVREIRALLDAGVDVRILSLKPPSESLVQEDAAALLDRVHYPARGLASLIGFARVALRHPIGVAGTVAAVLADGWRRPPTALKSLGALWRGLGRLDWVRQFAPDLIHAHWATYPSTVAWALARLTGLPFGFTCHAHDIFIERQLLARKIAEAQLPVTISQYNVDWLQDRLQSRLPQKFRIVHCGVDLATIPAHPQCGRTPGSILSVGRLDPIKGFDTLIDALALLKQRNVAFRCRLVGAGELENDLKARARARDVANHIEFTGVRGQDAVRAWMAESEIFVMPSQIAADGNRDGIPVALMEAMASGCAVVGTRVSGIPELIEDQRDGLLVEARQPQQLADALQRLLADAELRRRLADQGRRRVTDEFDARKEGARLHTHMREAVEAHLRAGEPAHVR